MNPIPLQPPVTIDYTNHRGERRLRHISPISIRFETSNRYHGAGWILVAFDCDKLAEREFAMKDIHSWQEAML